MNIYRKLWVKHHGPVPKDWEGRTYEIHHIDGNHDNNMIQNLRCVSIREHYDIHWFQGDWGACVLLAKTMKMSPKEISHLLSLSNKQRIENGTHHFLDKEAASKRAKNQLKNGTHPFLDGEKTRQYQLKLVKDGIHHLLGGKIHKQHVLDRTHHLLGGKHAKQRVENGTHHLLGGKIQRKSIEAGTFQSQKEYICPHCGKIGKGNGMFKHHFDRCKFIDS